MVLKCGLVGWLVVPVVVDRQENWVEHCGDGSCRCSGCRSMYPRCHQRREWGCSSDWMGLQQVEVRLHGLWIGDVVSRNVVVGEIDDVEEPRESGVLAVIFVCMGMGFCGPWRVSWMIDNEEEENEVELHVEENSDGDGNVQKVDGNVILESWIVVGVLVMVELVVGEEERWLELGQCEGPERPVRWVWLSVQVEAWRSVVV